MTRTSLATLQRFAERDLEAVSVPAEEATTVADTLVEADPPRPALPRRAAPAGLHRRRARRRHRLRRTDSVGVRGATADRLDAADGFGQVAMARALPVGGHKGSGLATAVELLTGAITGARFSDEITDMWVDPSAHMETGHLVVALRPLPAEHEAQRRVTALLERLRRRGRPRANHWVLVPGDLERIDAPTPRRRASGCPTACWMRPGGSPTS